MTSRPMGGWLLGTATLVAIVSNLALLGGAGLAAGSPELAAGESTLREAAPTTRPAPPAPEAAKPVPSQPAPIAEPDPPTAPATEDETTEAAPATNEPEREIAPEAFAAADRVFRRIVRAYESMEADGAAAALTRLAEEDSYSVVRTLLAMDPLRAGAVLDSMSRRAPDTTAKITAEMLAEASPSAFDVAR